MKSYNKIAIVAGILAAATGVQAQNTYSGYFLDGYTYRFQMNPAFGNEDQKTGFVAMPVLGNFNTAIRGDLHLSSLLYNVNGKTVLFTNPGVTTSEVLSNIHDRNKLGTNNKIDLLSAGFKAFGGYNTISISALANVEMSVPGSLFSMLKEGVTNKTYDITNLYGYANAYAQVALNHSRDIKEVPGLRVGAAVKLLIGVANVDFDLNKAELALNEDNWTMTTNADIYASVTGLKFEQKTYEPKFKGTGAIKPYDYVSGFNLDDGFGINGMGVAFDLGAEYQWREFKFSLAALDLGFMNWGKTQWASTNGDRTVQTNDYIFNANDGADNSFSHEFDRLGDDLSRLYNVQEMPELSSRSKSLATTINAGVDYKFYYYDKLHFGLMNTTRINGKYSWTNFRLSANVAPVKLFSASANFGIGTFGADFGWMLNLHTTGINLFIGMDHTLGKLAKQMIPLNSNASFNFGLNFPF